MGITIGQEFLPGVNVVGAVDYANTPAYGVSPTIEPYSSVGPGEIVFNGNGNLLSAPVIPNESQFTATGGMTVASAGSGFAGNPFGGTSQAAPNAGAVAALVLSADPTLSTARITPVFAQSAIPVVAPTGDSGTGLIQARAAVEIGADDTGARWSAASGGNWTTTAGWSTNSTSVASQGVILSDIWAPQLDLFPAR